MQKNGPIGKKWTLMHGYADLYLETEKMPQQEFRTQISGLPATHVHFLHAKVEVRGYLIQTDTTLHDTTLLLCCWLLPALNMHCVLFCADLYRSSFQAMQTAVPSFNPPIDMTAAGSWQQVHLENACFLTSQHLGQI